MSKVFVYNGATGESVVRDATPAEQAELNRITAEAEANAPLEAIRQVRFARHAAYAAPDGPDAIFLRWQRGDATEQDWLDAVQAVKDAHPYP